MPTISEQVMPSMKISGALRMVPSSCCISRIGMHRKATVYCRAMFTQRSGSPLMMDPMNNPPSIITSPASQKGVSERKGVTLSRPRRAEMMKLRRKKISEKVRLIWPTRNRPQPLRKIAISREERAILSHVCSCAARIFGLAIAADAEGEGLARVVTVPEAAPRAAAAQTPFGAGCRAIPASSPIRICRRISLVIR